MSCCSPSAWPRSARDERVNKITPALFERFPTLEAFAEADVTEVEQYVKPCGFYHTKARDIVECAKILLIKHGGKVPGTMEELLKLPGVGRKTANLILGDVFKAPGAVVVDTHCIRLSNRMGLVDNQKDPRQDRAAAARAAPARKEQRLLPQAGAARTGGVHRALARVRALLRQARLPDRLRSVIVQQRKPHYLAADMQLVFGGV